MALPPLISAMLDPGFYPHRPAHVELQQTHISYVCLAGDLVYKVKKPVRFSFLDFSSAERRLHFCREEVRLNRRLAPHSYVGVVGFRPDRDGYAFTTDSDPAAVDYAVVMHRLPDARLLDHLLEHGTVTLDMIDTVAERLAAFHAAADCGPNVTANGDPDAVRRILLDNYRNAQPFRGSTIDPEDDDTIQAFAHAFLARKAPLFRQRQAERRIRDGHGDLHTEHLCFTDGLVIFDCIEFNPAFRYCDVASDLAFLAMDLDYHGRPDLSARLVATYVARTGDAAVPHLLPFYACYRAYVRGKVDSLKSTEPDVGDAERAAARTSACRHFALAYRYLWAYTRCLVVVLGLSGTGKSAVAEALCRRTGFAHINSDVVRKTLPGVPRAELYSAATSARTYAAMHATAAAGLRDGRAVVLDATFQRRADRDAAAALAAQAGVPLLVVECRCPDETVHTRLLERSLRGDSVSDADWSVYLTQKQHSQPRTPDEAGHHLVLDTDEPLERLVRRVEAALRTHASD